VLSPHGGRNPVKCLFGYEASIVQSVTASSCVQTRQCAVQYNDRMTKPLKVNKAAFDDVLRKLAHSAPVKKSEVKTDKTKPAKIISPQK